MLLVSMGTQPIQCERIINSILDANIKDEIIIQAYYKNESNRIIPKNVLIKEFIPYDEMENYINKANVVVVSGTGGIFRALQKGKKVIIYPRLGKYKEAVNDHGLDMKVLEDKGLVIVSKKLKWHYYSLNPDTTELIINGLTRTLSNTDNCMCKDAN